MMSNHADFALEGDDPPSSFSTLRRALWWDAKGCWDKAHDIVADDASRSAAWVHAYLHRREGDSGNARYWYARAGKEPHTGALDQEWQELATALTE